MEEIKNQWTQSIQGKTAIGIGIAFLLLLIIAIPTLIESWTNSDSVKIDGKSYGLNDIKKSSPSLHSRYLSEVTNTKKEIFSEFAEKKILEIAAKEAGLDDPDAVLRQGFTPTEISEQELQSIYNQYKSQLGGRSFADSKEMIRKQLMMQQERQFTQNKQRELIQKYEVAFNIQEPPTVRHDVPEAGNPSLGPKNAKITVIEFSDFECPFCKRSQEVNKKLRDKYKDQIRWVFRDFPLDFHENAMYAHMAANCAIPQNKYWEYFDILFQNTGNLSKSNVDYLATKAGLDKTEFQNCMKDEDKLRAEVEADMKEGQKFGVTGTPAFFINGIFVSGAMPFEHFDEIIQKELN
ncbi:MAG: DsbA family protein [Leptospira sp.]|nr:DsbA family protein [Leptospira sp.]